jgi:CheY-like chemotaxis protein
MATVLVLEDEFSNLSVFRLTLEYHGYKVLTARDGPAALAFFQVRAPIDLLVADILLGSENGFVLAQQIRLYDPIPVLFVSGSPLGDLERNQLLRLSDFPSDQVMFLEKPFTLRDLLNEVSQLLARKSSAHGSSLNQAPVASPAV